MVIVNPFHSANQTKKVIFVMDYPINQTKHIHNVPSALRNSYFHLWYLISSATVVELLHGNPRWPPGLIGETQRKFLFYQRKTLYF